MSEPVIHANGLTKRFDDVTVLRNLDLDVAEGTIYGYIGPSGSGKTTTVRALTGVIEPTAGTVRIMGTDPRTLDTDQRQKVGYMPQMGVLYPHLSIMDNLRFTASLYGRLRAKARIMEVLTFLDLKDDTGKTLSQASGGMQRRVALAAALLHDPTILFLDEPTSGLDPVLRQRIWDRLGELRDDGRTMFVTTQVVSEAANCDRVGLIADGRLVADGTPEELRRQTLGGDVLLVRTAQPIPVAVEADSAANEIILAFDRTDESEEVRVTVADADRDSQDVTAWLSEHGVEVVVVERYQPSFDEVFVTLLQREESA